MEQSEQHSNKFTIPFAIVIAGALIAGAVYLANTKNNPKIVSQNATNDQTQATAVSADLNIRPISSADHFLGDPNAPVKMFVYTDTECPFCKEFHSTMQSVMSAFGSEGKVVWIYRHFPLQQLHTKAPQEAIATECAASLGGQSAFWKYVNEIFKVTPSNDGLDPNQLPVIAKDAGLNVDDFNTCLSSGKFESEVKADFDEAINAGGRGTPFIIFTVKNSLSASQIATINGLASTFPPGTLTLASDNKHVVMSGALPGIIVTNIINALLGTS